MGYSCFYSGEFYKGEKNGISTYIWEDNNKYSGEIKKSIFHGYWIYKYNDGRKYCGHWNNNYIEG